MPREEAEWRLEPYRNGLSREFPSWVFNEDSAHAVARQCKGWPQYSQLCDLLNAWQREHMPQQLAIADGRRAGLGAMDSLWLTYWEKRKPEVEEQEQRMGYAVVSQMDPAQRPMAVLADLIQKQAPKAWSVIKNGECDEACVSQ